MACFCLNGDEHMKFTFAFTVSLMLSIGTYAQTEMRAEVPQTPQAPHVLRGIFGLSVSSGKDLYFNNSTAKNRAGSSFDGNTTFGLDRNFALDLGLQSIPAEGWGFSALLTYEPRIRITTYDEHYGKGNNFKGKFEDEPWLDLVTFSGNAVYGLNKFYIPFGLNYTIPTYEATGVDTATKNGMGYQVGIGMHAFENLTLELAYQRKSFGLKEVLKNGVVFSRENGSINGLGLQARMLY